MQSFVLHSDYVSSTVNRGVGDEGFPKNQEKKKYPRQLHTSKTRVEQLKRAGVGED